MLKKITGVIITMSVLFSMFLTTPVYAANKKVATELKEVTGVTLSTKEDEIRQAKEDERIENNAKIENQIRDKFGSNFICMSIRHNYASVIADNGCPAIYNIKTKKLIPTDYEYDYILECISDLAIVSISDGSQYYYNNGKGLEILDLNTGKIVTNEYGNVVCIEPVFNNDEIMGLSVFRSDGIAIVIYDKGLSLNEYKGVDVFNTKFFIDSKYIYEELSYPYYGTKLYDLKTNELLATSSNTISYNKDANIFVVNTPADSSLNFKTRIYNTEGKQLGEFDSNVNQKFVGVINENNLRKPIIMYEDYSMGIDNPIKKYYEIIYSYIKQVNFSIKG